MITKNLKYHQVLDTINYRALLLFLFCLPLSDRLINLAGIIWIISCLSLAWFKTTPFGFPNINLYIGLIAYFLLTCSWFFFSDDRSLALSNIETKLSLVVFPLLFYLSGDKLKQNPDKLFLAFIAGNLIASVYCYVHTFVTNIIVENGSWYLRISFLKENAHLSFWKLVNSRTCTFSYEFLSELKQSSYFAMYIIFSFCMAIYLYLKRPVRKIKYKIFLAGYLVYFTFFLYLLQSRAAILSLLLLLSSLMVWVIIKRRKKILFLIAIPLLIAGIFFISFNSKISYNIKQIERIIKNPSKVEIEGENDRFQMWYSSLPIIKENFVFGIGPSNVTNKLVEKYVMYKFSMAEKFKLNAHNQYLESLLGLGIIGLLILLYILAYCLIKSFRQKNYLLLILVLMLCFEFLFESVLNRMIGIVFMMTFVSMFLFTDIPFYKDAYSENKKDSD